MSPIAGFEKAVVAKNPGGAKPPAPLPSWTETAERTEWFVTRSSVPSPLTSAAIVTFATLLGDTSISGPKEPVPVPNRNVSRDVAFAPVPSATPMSRCPSPLRSPSAKTARGGVAVVKSPDGVNAPLPLPSSRVKLASVRARTMSSRPSSL